MAEDMGDKTEAPTPKRRAEAREQGNIARSPDLTAAAVILGLLMMLDWYGPGLVGALTGAALGWSLSRWVIHVPWHAPVADTAAGIAATTVLVGVVGLVSSLDVLRRKPLSTLRAE